MHFGSHFAVKMGFLIFIRKYCAGIYRAKCYTLCFPETAKQTIKKSCSPVLQFCLVILMMQDLFSRVYTATSTKVVSQKRKSVRDNADGCYG